MHRGLSVPSPIPPSSTFANHNNEKQLQKFQYEEQQKLMDEVFSKPPKSFNLARKSNFASKLKSLISHHLLLFYPQFCNDVLAEYITVLVCNGKTQNQARDDLEAFFGGRAQEFIAWLWKFLLKNETQLTVSVSSSQKDKPNASGTSENCRSQENSDSVNFMDECEKTCSLRQACKSADTEPPKDHHLCPLEVTKDSSFQSTTPQKKVANSDSTIKVLSSVKKYQTETLDGFEKTTYLAQKDSASLHGSVVENSSHITMLSNKDPSSLLRKYPASLQEIAPGSETQFSNVSKLSVCPQIHYEGNTLKRKLYVPSVAPPSHIKKPRRSVWDRLGKPKHDALSRSKAGGAQTQLSKKWVAQEGRRKLGQFHQISQEDGADKNDVTMRPKHVGMTYCEVPCNINVLRKRQFDEIGSHTDAGVALEKGADNHLDKAWQSHKISKQVSDVKLRLCQIEREMVKLRTNLMEKDGTNNLLTDTGVVKPTEEDSRTIRVTNVHVKATKETLSMFFQKCGAVVNVVMLTDYKDSAQQRSAFITFQNKAAADKALRFSGASFYSRTIKVFRKDENTNTMIGQEQIASDAGVSLDEQHVLSQDLI